MRFIGPSDRMAFMKRNFFIFTALVVLGVFSRLVPHGWNFTAIGAISLVSGLLISNRFLSLITPFVALVISDLYLGFHYTIPFVYGAYALIAALGFAFNQQKHFKNILAMSVASSLIFFVISNFGVWVVEDGLGYAKNFSGLMECFAMGVPFYRNQFLSDLILTPVLFYSFVHLLNFQFLAETEHT